MGRRVITNFWSTLCGWKQVLSGTELMNYTYCPLVVNWSFWTHFCLALGMGSFPLEWYSRGHCSPWSHQLMLHVAGSSLLWLHVDLLLFKFNRLSVVLKQFSKWSGIGMLFLCFLWFQFYVDLLNIFLFIRLCETVLKYIDLSIIFFNHTDSM